ncbi:MAG: sugar ABC transporter substrate-binding protein [Alphaproteobacteria bacterium]
MNMLSKALLGATIALGLATASVHAGETRIVFVVHGQASDPFWSVVKNGVDAAAERMGVTAQYQAPATFDMVAMKQMIDSAIASEPDGLVVSIPDADALGPSIRDAVAAGIPVISMDSGEEVSKELGALLHMGINEYDSGLAAGKRMKKAGLKSGLCVNQEVGNVALDLRCQGFKDGLAGNSQVVAVSMDPTEIRNGVAAFLGQHPEVDAMLTVGAVAFDPTLAAIDEAQLTGKVQIGSFDLSPTLLQAIADGRAMYAIDAQQYLTGYLPVVFLTLYKEYGMIPTSNVMTGPLFVTKDTARQVIELSARGIR